MDIVYICKDGKNEELRYSIRSVVANLEFDNLWVVGGKPDWYIGNHISVKQDKAKYANARNNLAAICNSEEISDSFVLMNDDFYIIEKVSNIPYMHGGSLKDKVDLYRKLSGNTSYVSMLNTTLINLSRKFKREVLDYELHVPMVMEKEKLKKVINYKDFWRSRYGNMYGVGGTMIEDVKVYLSGSLVKKSYSLDNIRYPYLSSSEDSFEVIKSKILNNLFSNKSIYEIND